MSEETPISEQAPVAEAKPKRGLFGFGGPRKKLTMKEQIREIMPLIVAVIIGGIGYGIYFGYSYTHIGTFTLTDQFYKETTVDFAGEKPYVVMVSSLDSTRDAVAWAIKLAGGYGDKIENVRLADLSSSEPGIHGVIQGQFAKNMPVAILLDYDGKISRSMYAKKDSVNILVVDSGGAIKVRTVGELTDAGWAEVGGAIDALLQ